MAPQHRHHQHHKKVNKQSITITMSLTVITDHTVLLRETMTTAHLPGSYKRRGRSGSHQIGAWCGWRAPHRRPGPANSPPPCRPGWPAGLPRSESEAGLSRPPPSSTQLTTSVHSAFNSWWAHLSYIFLNMGLSRPFSGFLMFPFSWYIVGLQLINLTMVYYNRKQERRRRRNSMRRSITC